MSAARTLRTTPDPARLSCWCGGWGHFNNTAKDPPELTYCGNCENAEEAKQFEGLSELQKDLSLARLGDYPGAAGCRRIAAAYDALAASADTHPKDGDVQQTSLVSGAVPKADAQKDTPQ